MKLSHLLLPSGLILLAGPLVFGQTTSGPGIIPIGSPLTFGGTNAPDTYSATTTFGPNPVTVDNGAVKIWQTQTPTGPSGEWDVFYMQTTSGGPLAGNINGYWNIVMNYVLNANVNFDGVVNQWLVNGTPVSPITDGIGSICCASTTNPIIPGPAYYKTGFTVPYPAGPFSNWQQLFVSPYSFVQSGGINPSAANEFIFALHFTLQAAIPKVTGAVSASAFGDFSAFAPGSWIEIYGTGLASTTRTWAGSDFNGVYGPTKLAGTSVTIGGQQAFIDYVSATQVNVQVPGGISPGTQQLIVTTDAGASAPFSVTVNATEPGLLSPPSFNIGGTQYVTAQFTDGTFVLPPNAIANVQSRRAKPGDSIIIYGVGFGDVTPSSPPGQLVGLQNSLNLPFKVSFFGVPATVTYDGLAPTYMGLYQFNVTVPSIPASDIVPLTFTLNGVAGSQKLSIAISN